ncbi:MAG: hypothetical protein CVU11_06175 [Bacteroidetes bacterium HGW-Bacteroidetes-6]|jgi:predicted TIM-barrel fold metal-dependent hydrolase|nr:MAG: hypothetical protein CVU11_06175 [Bacteroidetes bacterium HGW-Bacteroidetes-6]
MDTQAFYNCHIHTFNEEDIPERFYPKLLMDFLRKESTEELMLNFLRFVHKLEKFFGIDAEEAERYLQFYLVGSQNSQREIFDLCRSSYPPSTKYFVLSMDMQFMGCGDVPRDFRAQLAELSQIDQEQILPFVHIDPRRDGYFDILRDAIEQMGFRGVKLYPPLGVFPHDSRFDSVYQYCIDNNLPIVSHCSPHNPTHFKGSRRELLKLLQNPYFEINPHGLDKKDLCDIFTHPKNYRIVCEKYPELRISLAHYGSDKMWTSWLCHPEDPENWVNIINSMIQEYPNLYTDISYTMYYNVTDCKHNFYKTLKEFLDNENIRRKVLFGSDFYMPASKETDMHYANNIIDAIGEEYFNAIAVENPKQFLNEQIA